jgi:diguanylate cyclase (GGDEF)-like protein
MAEDTGSLHIQQLVELLAELSTYTDQAAMAQGAVERTAQALEAEVAAVVFDGRVAASVGFPAGAVPQRDIVAVALRQRDGLPVPGLGNCHTAAAGWGGTHPGQLVLARHGDDFTVAEQSLIRGMARLLQLALTMVRTLQAEQTVRRRSERQAAVNAELLLSLQNRQRLLEHLFEIQQEITARQPLQRILDVITASTRDALGDDLAVVWQLDPHEIDRATLEAASGLRYGVARRLRVKLADAGVGGAAMLADAMVVVHGREDSSAAIGQLSPAPVYASLAAPVHVGGKVTGSLLVASCDPARTYTETDAQTLRTFAEHVSLAMNDAHTLDRVRRAQLDPVTSLINRGPFLERLSAQLAKATGPAGRERVKVALLFLDLDRFKDVNDTLGHGAGDEMLTIAANRISAELGTADLASRFGGDEFAVMLPNVSGSADAAEVAERLVRTLAEPMIVDDQRVTVSVSLGVAMFPPGPADAGDLLRRADVAMYQAKRNGRGRYEVFSEDMLTAFAEGMP